MRPDVAFLVAIALAFCGIVAVVAGAVGQASLRSPRCRRCRADVRDRAWDSAPRCSCGAALDAHGAVRFVGRERSLSAVIAGALLVAAGIGVSWWHLSLREQGLSWRELLPASWEVANLRSDREPNNALDSLRRRAAAQTISPADRAAALDAIGASPSARRDLASRTIAALVGHPAMLEPPFRDAVDRAFATLETWRTATPAPTISGAGLGGVSLAPGPGTSAPFRFDMRTTSGFGLIVLVDEARRGDTPIRGVRGIGWADQRGMRWEPLEPRAVPPAWEWISTPDAPPIVTVKGRYLRLPATAVAAVVERLVAGEACPAEIVHHLTSFEATVPVPASGSEESVGSSGRSP